MAACDSGHHAATCTVMLSPYSSMASLQGLLRLMSCGPAALNPSISKADAIIAILHELCSLTDEVQHQTMQHHHWAMLSRLAVLSARILERSQYASHTHTYCHMWAAAQACLAICQPRMLHCQCSSSCQMQQCMHLGKNKPRPLLVQWTSWSQYQAGTYHTTSTHSWSLQLQQALRSCTKLPYQLVQQHNQTGQNGSCEA